MNKESRLDVMGQLKLSKSAYYYHLDAMREEDEAWLTELAKGEFVSEMRRSLDTLDMIERMLFASAAKAQRDRDRIEALRLAKEVELDRVTLLGEGPTALAIRRRAKKELDDPKGNVQQAS